MCLGPVHAPLASAALFLRLMNTDARSAGLALYTLPAVGLRLGEGASRGAWSGEVAITKLVGRRPPNLKISVFLKISVILYLFFENLGVFDFK